MVGHDSRRWLATGLALSLFLHATLALWMAWPRQASAALQPEREANRPDPQPLIEKLKLGDPDSDQMGVSWLGFKEYERHAARKSEVEQPELRKQQSAPTLAPRAAAMASAAARETQRQVERRLEAAEEALEAAERALAILAAQAERQRPADPGTAREVAERPPEQERRAEEPPTEVVEAASGGTPSPAQRPTPQATGGENPSNAQVADRESDASSVVDVTDKQLGKPVAAKGLRVKTVRPRFSHYTAVRANPRDPVVRIHFGANGQVTLVEFVVRSGNPDVDRPVEDAAYQWTAEGRALENLERRDPEGSIAIEVRILF
jgi:cell wall-associated NlpC family hydrolase